MTKRREGNGPYQEVEVLHLFKTYAIEIVVLSGVVLCTGRCEGRWVLVHCIDSGIGKTKQNANKEVVYIRENCGVVDRREIDGKMKKKLDKNLHVPT